MGPYWRHYKSIVCFFLSSTAQFPLSRYVSCCDDQTHLGTAQTQILGLVIHALGMNGQQDAYYVSSAHFTHGIKANVWLKSSIPIGAKVEISLKGFTLKTQGWNRKILFNLPQVTYRCWTFMALYWPQGLKKRIPLNLGSQFATFEANVPAYILICWHQCSSIYQ